MLKAKIEAVLFLTDKPMKAQVIARTLNEDVQVVRQGILELIHDYEERKSGLEIADDNGYIIQVKDEYSALINEFAPLEMPLGLLRTLSAIAIKQPVQQSEIIKIRGAGAYDHIKELMVRELVIKKEADEGRSPLLSTTKAFQEYFRLSGDGKSLRTELRKDKKAAADKVEDDAAAATAVQLQLAETLSGQSANNEQLDFSVTGTDSRDIAAVGLTEAMTASSSDRGDATLVSEAEAMPAYETESGDVAALSETERMTASETEPSNIAAARQDEVMTASGTEPGDTAAVGASGSDSTFGAADAVQNNAPVSKGKRKSRVVSADMKDALPRSGEQTQSAAGISEHEVIEQAEAQPVPLKQLQEIFDASPDISLVFRVDSKTKVKEQSEGDDKVVPAPISESNTN